MSAQACPPMTLTTAERAALLTPCPHCGHTFEEHGGTIPCWTCSNDGAPACPANFEDLLVERVAGIVAAQVEARLAAVTALADEWTTATCQTDGAPCSWHRVSAECAAELRRALDQGGRATGGGEG